MSRSDGKYDSSSSKPVKQVAAEPTVADVLGNGVWTRGDKTGNLQHNDTPPRTKLPGRGDPADSLDRFSPEASQLEYDFFEEDEMSEAMPESQPQHSIAHNSQRNLARDTPSILSSSSRFAHQGGSKK